MESGGGKWGLYPWFEEHGTELVHPDDLGEFRRLIPYGKVFHCVCVEGDYLVLQYRDFRFRVRSKLFEPVTTPRFDFGARVLIYKASGNVVTGVVYDIGWHFQKAQLLYYVLVSGKRLSKRYWESDLRRTDRT